MVVGFFSFSFSWKKVNSFLLEEDRMNEWKAIVFWNFFFVIICACFHSYGYHKSVCLIFFFYVCGYNKIGFGKKARSTLFWILFSFHSPLHVWSFLFFLFSFSLSCAKSWIFSSLKDLLFLTCVSKNGFYHPNWPFYILFEFL